ncbi:Soluble pyridine nucleotide transhydrogenase [gamma proteobacterium IMCC1989]|nr:Soluble pyridine nucleotide transhydrogenase [gamma proteobacterium IMCC1989]
MKFDYDLLVVGSGPAGEGAAMAAIKNGLRVAAVENREDVGGSCLHKGTIPSKSLRHVIQQIIRYKKSHIFNQLGDTRSISFPDALKESKRVIPKQVDVHNSFYVKNRVNLFNGVAKFISKHEIEISSPNSISKIVTAKDFIIATGSRPYNPDGVDFSHPRVYDSDSILEMDHTPRTIIIYGAGVIGCEYASIFAGLGIKVDLINTRDRLLSFLDDEISGALNYHLRDVSVMIRHQEEFDYLDAEDDSVTVHLKSGKRLYADAILWCNGRTGNTDTLQLDAIGLEPDRRGQLTVDETYRTSVDNVYAAGDVIGWPSLASASYDQGRAAAGSILGRDINFVNDVPTGIYTLPEISSIGKTERELTDERVPYEVGRAFFKSIARAQISGEEVGMLKILFHIDTFEILGIHCFGAEASEIIHIGQAIMKQPGKQNDIKYFLNTTFNYPTMAEAYRIAALAGLNRIQRFSY